MRPSAPLSIAGTILVILLNATSVQAQATRTWVSGLGDDVNPCSRTAPWCDLQDRRHWDHQLPR